MHFGKWQVKLAKTSAVALLSVGLINGSLDMIATVQGQPNIAYADSKTVKKNKVTISANNTADATKTGYIASSGSVLVDNIHDSKKNGEIYYGVSSKNSKSGKAYHFSNSSGQENRAISGVGAKSTDYLQDISASKDTTTMFRGSDGFYYKKDGKDQQAYYAWEAGEVEDNALASTYSYNQSQTKSTGNDVIYFIPVKVVKDSKPKEKVIADVSKNKKGTPANTGKVDKSTYANLGDEPTTNVLLAEIMYTYGGADGTAIKDGKLEYNNIRKYPAPTKNIQTDSEVYEKENKSINYYSDGKLGAYIPNQLTMSSSNTIAGNTLANMLRILGGWGFLQVDATATSTNTTTNNTYLNTVGQLWNFGSGWATIGANSVILLVSPIIALAAEFFDLANELLRMILSLIIYVGELVGNPLAWFGLVGGQSVEAPNWLAEVVGSVREQFLSNDMAKTVMDDLITLVKWISVVTLIVAIVVFVFRLTFRKKGKLRVFSTTFFKLTAWIPLVVGAYILTGAGESGQVAGGDSTVVSSTKIDILELFLATNGNLAKVYTDDGTLSQIIGTNSINIDDFELTNKQITQVNEYIRSVLGDQLKADLDTYSDASTATFNVNDYLEATKLASKSTNKALIPATQLPKDIPISWNDNGTLYVKGSPMLFVSGVANTHQSANLLPNGYEFNGTAYMFTKNYSGGEESESGDDDETQYAYFSTKAPTKKNLESGLAYKKYSIPYNSSYWNKQAVSLDVPWTYLYGANPNNNRVTEDPRTYTFGTNGNFLIQNLKSEAGDSFTYDSDDDTPDAITSEDAVSYQNIQANKESDHKYPHYWKYVNAYNIALLNKYQGTNSVSNSSMQLSNQSMVFLLQSNLTETGLDFYATNTNNSESAKGKSRSATDYKYRRLISPQKQETQAVLQINGAFQTFAFTMLLVAYIRRLSTMTVVDYIGGRYKALGSVGLGSWSNAIYYNVLTYFWALITIYVPRSFDLATNIMNTASQKASTSDSFGGSYGALGVGVVALGIAWVFSKQFGGGNGNVSFSLVSSVVDILDAIRIAIKSFLFGKWGPDSLLYGREIGLVGGLLDGDGGRSGSTNFTPVTMVDADGNKTVPETEEEKDSSGKDGSEKDGSGQSASAKGTSEENGSGATETTEKAVEQAPAKERIKGMASNGSGRSLPLPTPVPTPSSSPTPTGFRGKVAEKAGALKDKALDGMQQLKTANPYVAAAKLAGKATVGTTKAISNFTGLTDLKNDVVGAGPKYITNPARAVTDTVKTKTSQVVDKLRNSDIPTKDSKPTNAPKSQPQKKFEGNKFNNLERRTLPKLPEEG